MPSALPADLAAPVGVLRADLEAVFGPRLHAVVAYGPRLLAADARPSRARRPPLNTLALVNGLSFDDLQACTARADQWDHGQLAVPLLLDAREFARSLDVFPFEYGDIVSRHVLIAGSRDPFEGLGVRREDLRRACEAQAKGHLIHLRGGYLQTRGRAEAVAELLTASAAPFAALLGNLARLRDADASTPDALVQVVEAVPGVNAATVRDVVGLVQGRILSHEDARSLYPAYLETTTRLVEYLDTWTPPVERP